MDVVAEGAPIRSIYNPAKIGVSTGRSIRQHGQTFVFVRWRDGSEEPIPDDELEVAPTEETRLDAFAAGRFSSPAAVIRALMVEKIKGQLTNVLYSMGAGQANFYPHQFKPVLTFFSGGTGRILIADEVGLGKTVEAIYIWRELQARVDARRLLVVCPAVLRTKWQNELRDRFQIDARIVSATELLDITRDAERDPSKTFAAIVGLESIRVRRDALERDEGKRSSRVELGEFLLGNEAREDFALYDLLVIDEAHYLRNPDTATHQMGLLLSAASAHLTMLTATPIQIGTENLYNLLKLVDPDRFSSLDSFERIRRANKDLTEALNAIRETPVQQDAFSRAVKNIRGNSFFRGDNLFEQWTDAPPNVNQPDERAWAARKLEERSLLANVLSRTRKRDILQNRVIREPIVRVISLNAAERDVYEQVTKTLRQRSYGSNTVNTLALIARQRQLASSIPAAIAGWASDPATAELLIDELGFALDPDDVYGIEDVGLGAPSQTVLSKLEASDTKYYEFLTFVTGWIKQHPSDKVVVFSFFRATLSYLRRRLKADGINCALIQGGMGTDKDAEIERFRDPRGPNLLLSSEVGSEGIDLQFSRVVVNYDLPWNPMRVEQRIGRIDRLGQNADKIHIVSFVLQDTIEQVILERLYNRIRIFEQSIGDLEEILGESIDKIAVDYFHGELSDAQVALRLEQNAIAAAAHRDAVVQLEEAAPELTGNMEFILASIQAGREAGRWIRPDDLQTYVVEALNESYPGSRLLSVPQSSGVYLLTLSPAAGAALDIFMTRTRPHRGSRLRVAGREVKVVFDPAAQAAIKPQPEIIDITHPLIGLLRADSSERRSEAEPVTAVAIDRARANFPDGIYVFATDMWRLEGFRRDIRLSTIATSLSDQNKYSGDEADRLIDVALRMGERVDIAEFPDLQHDFVDAFRSCEDVLSVEFALARKEFRDENKRRIEQARLLVEERSAAKLSQLEELLDQQRRSDDAGRRKASQMTAGRISKLVADRDQRLARIKATAQTETTYNRIAGGIILVGER